MNISVIKHLILPIRVALLVVGFCLGPAQASGGTVDQYAGRSMIVFLPSQPQKEQGRALVVVLYGGLGSAQRIE